ncbi:MAG: polyphosphate kinase 1 [Cyanobacteria bacterium P01_D01_bin.73]
MTSPKASPRSSQKPPSRPAPRRKSRQQSTANSKAKPKNVARSPQSASDSSDSAGSESDAFETVDLSDSQYYFNRELSWIEFDRRVLSEGMDERNPLLERLKFLAIFSSNLDEFFMVRVASLLSKVGAKVTKTTPDGRSPQQQLDEVGDRLHPLVQQQHEHFAQELRPAMAKAGIYLLDYVDLNQEQRSYLHDYFEQEIFPVLTPLAVDPAHPFPRISNLSSNLVVLIQDPESGEEHFARVKIPNALSRFLPLSLDGFDREALTGQWAEIANEVPPVWVGVPIEQAIAHNLELLFPGMKILEYHPFRVTRNSDIDVEEDDADDLMLAIEQELRKRRLGGNVVRLEVLTTMPDEVRDRLISELDVLPEYVFEVEGLLGLNDLMSFMGLPLPQLKDQPWSAVIPTRVQRLGSLRNAGADEFDLDNDGAVDDSISIFTELQRQDLLVHHPYHSFSATVQRFITEAANDPQVLAIKMTLYRTSGNSPIVNALIQAAENGKQVAVLVELKARFDEANNINWARTLERAGVHVIYGLVGLKTHTKVVLVVRRDRDGLRRYVHIGTGNYNPKTAKLYTDLGLLSCREDLGADLTDLFNYLTGYSRQKSFRKLLIAPINLRSRMIELVDREIDHVRQGRPGRIVAKMNSLVDPPIIKALYRASQAGVSIDLIIRGICCLRPGMPGVSDNIRVISIVGRLLEHSRVFYFGNDGEDEVYIGSADWMPRNLTRRVEAVTPVEDAAAKQDLQEIMGVMLADTRNAWELQPDGQYLQRLPAPNAEPESSQEQLMKLAIAQTS